jgi:hypothetical protein
MGEWNKTVKLFVQNPSCPSFLICPMLHAQKTTENGQKTRFSTLPDCFGQTAAEMRPPIFLSTENTLVYIRHLFLGKNVKNRQFWEFLKKNVVFKPRFKGGRGRIG